MWDTTSETTDLIMREVAWPATASASTAPKCLVLVVALSYLLCC